MRELESDEGNVDKGFVLKLWHAMSEAHWNEIWQHYFRHGGCIVIGWNNGACLPQVKSGAVIGSQNFPTNRDSNMANFLT